jgi:hypothetical protein
MASVAQTIANRSNAQKSTGPRTAEGKAVVAQNAVQHGLLAQRAVIKGEDPGAFALYRDRMLEDLDPMGSVEAVLAERVVNLAWRLRRAERLENAALAMLEAEHATKATAQPAAYLRPKGGTLPEGEPQADEESVLARVVVEDFGDGKLLDQLLGYERRIENSLYRTMGELRKQRLVREWEASSLKCEVPDKQSQLPGSPGRPTSSVTLRTSDEEPSCETKPIHAGGSEDRAPGDEKTQDVGRGRPTRSTVAPGRLYEETPDGVTTNTESAGPFCETDPLDAGGGPGRACGGVPCETKPIGGTA